METTTDPALGPTRSHWIPLAIGGALALAALFFWRELASQRVEAMAQTLGAVARSGGAQLAARLESSSRALERMATRWEIRGSIPREEWEVDASLYVEHGVANEAVVFVGSDSRVRWIVPREAEAYIGADVSIFPELARLASDDRAVDPWIGSLFGRADRSGIVIAVPVRAASSRGAIALFSRSDELFSRFLSVVEPEFDLEVVADGRTLYRRGGRASDVMAVSAELEVHGHVLEVLAYPTAAWLQRTRSRTPEAALIAGLIIAVLVAGAAHLAGLARARARDAWSAAESARIAQRDARKLAERSSWRRPRRAWASGTGTYRTTTWIGTHRCTSCTASRRETSRARTRRGSRRCTPMMRRARA